MWENWEESKVQLLHGDQLRGIVMLTHCTLCREYANKKEWSTVFKMFAVSPPSPFTS